MRGRELLLVVLTGLIISAIAVYFSGLVERTPPLGDPRRRCHLRRFLAPPLRCPVIGSGHRRVILQVSVNGPPKQKECSEELLDNAVELHGYGDPFTVVGLRMGLVADNRSPY
jgi:hypothetical protein